MTLPVKRLRVGVTGSPATGKKSIGLALASELGVPFLGLNEMARKAGYLAVGADEPIFDARGFRRAAGRLLPRGGYVVSGLFLSDAIPPRLLDFVVVLRCNPLVLLRRYEERGYGERKRKENLTSEFLDTCLGEAVNAYGRKVREVDVSSRDVAGAVGEVKAVLVPGKFPVGVVDWLSIVRGPEDVFRFML